MLSILTGKQFCRLLKGKKLNFIPNDNFLDLPKFKAFRHLQTKKKKCSLKQEFFLEWVENIAERGENAGYQLFLLFPQCFQKGC